MQGKLVPRLLWYGQIIENIADALATEYSGESLDMDGVLTEERALAALQALNELHSLGVLHGDVALRNFVVLNDVVKIIDFGFARFRENVKQWNQAVQNKRKQLREALGLFEKATPKMMNVSLPIAA